MCAVLVHLQRGNGTELNQPRADARQRFRLDESGRSEAVQRRAKTHFGREHPISWSCLTDFYRVSAVLKFVIDNEQR